MNPEIRSQDPVWLQVAAFVSLYPAGVGRLDVAAHFRITKSVATYHLEKCVQRGKLAKVYTWIGANWRGWVYVNPDYLDLPADYQISAHAERLAQ